MAAGYVHCAPNSKTQLANELLMGVTKVKQEIPNDIRTD